MSKVSVYTGDVRPQGTRFVYPVIAVIDGVVFTTDCNTALQARQLVERITRALGIGTGTL